MTTNHHTAIATGAPANAAVINSPLEELDATMFSRLSIPALAFNVIGIGSPSIGNIGDGGKAASWLLDDTINEQVGTSISYAGEAGGSTIHVDVFWAMESATSGAARVTASVAAAGDGEDYTATATNGVANLTVPGTAKYMKKTTFSLSLPYASGDLIRVRVGRTGSDAGDTAVGDMHFLAIRLRFA